MPIGDKRAIGAALLGLGRGAQQFGLQEERRRQQEGITERFGQSLDLQERGFEFRQAQAEEDRSRADQRIEAGTFGDISAGRTAPGAGIEQLRRSGIGVDPGQQQRVAQGLGVTNIEGPIRPTVQVDPSPAIGQDLLRAERASQFGQQFRAGEAFRQSVAVAGARQAVAPPAADTPAGGFRIARETLNDPGASPEERINASEMLLTSPDPTDQALGAAGKTDAEADQAAALTRAEQDLRARLTAGEEVREPFRIDAEERVENRRLAAAVLKGEADQAAALQKIIAETGKDFGDDLGLKAEGLSFESLLAPTTAGQFDAEQILEARQRAATRAAFMIEAYVKQFPNVSVAQVVAAFPVSFQAELIRSLQAATEAESTRTEDGN